MSDDWKELEDAGQPCGGDNGWCGWCGRCREHSQDLHRRAEWEDEE